MPNGGSLSVVSLLPPLNLLVILQAVLTSRIPYAVYVTRENHNTWQGGKSARKYNRNGSVVTSALIRYIAIVLTLISRLSLLPLFPATSVPKVC